VEQRAGTRALVPDDVMRNTGFAAAALATLMMSAIFFAALLYLPQFMSKVLKFSAVGSGAGLLPVMGTFAVTSFVAGRLYARLGPKVSVTGGALFLTAGMFLLSRITPTTTYNDLIFGMFVLGIGVGLSIRRSRRRRSPRSMGHARVSVALSSIWRRLPGARSGLRPTRPSF